MNARVTLCGLGFWLALALGCTNTGRDVVAEQRPGSASGAGATLTGPTNSAAPSTQRAKRTTVYALPRDATSERDARSVTVNERSPRTAGGSRDVTAVTGPGSVTPATSSDAASSPEPRPVTPAISWQVEETETTLGQHQDASGIVKAAVYVSKWSGVKWLGLLCVVIGALGFGYGITHRETGYPLVFLKVAGVGVVLLIVAENPLWLLLLALPVGFYALQKLGALRPLP